jgi:hypothetical protein
MLTRVPRFVRPDYRYLYAARYSAAAAATSVADDAAKTTVHARLGVVTAATATPATHATTTPATTSVQPPALHIVGPSTASAVRAAAAVAPGTPQGQNRVFSGQKGKKNLFFFGGRFFGHLSTSVLCWTKTFFGSCYAGEHLGSPAPTSSVVPPGFFNFFQVKAESAPTANSATVAAPDFIEEDSLLEQPQANFFDPCHIAIAMPAWRIPEDDAPNGAAHFSSSDEVSSARPQAPATDYFPNGDGHNSAYRSRNDAVFSPTVPEFFVERDDDYRIYNPDFYAPTEGIKCEGPVSPHYEPMDDEECYDPYNPEYDPTLLFQPQRMPAHDDPIEHAPDMKPTREGSSYGYESVTPDALDDAARAVCPGCVGCHLGEVQLGMKRYRELNDLNDRVTKYDAVKERVKKERAERLAAIEEVIALKVSAREARAKWDEMRLRHLKGMARFPTEFGFIEVDMADVQ